MTADEFVERYQRLPVALLLATSQGIVEAVNGACADLLDSDAATLRGQPLEPLVSDDPHKLKRYLFLCSSSRDYLPGALHFRTNGNEIDVRANGAAAGEGSGQVLLHFVPRGETHRRFVALNDKISELAVEIEERRRTEALILAQNEVLGTIARDEPRGEVLRRVTALIAASGLTEVRASVLLRDEHGNLRTEADAGLPSEWIRAFESVASRQFPHMGAEPIIAADLTEDPRWPELHDLARAHQLHSGWCFPIASGAGELLGLLALFGRTPGEPGQRAWQASRVATATAAIAVERHRSSERLARILKRQRAMLDGLPARIALIDEVGRIRSVNSAWDDWLREASLPVRDAGVGANLLETCHQIFTPPACEGIRNVIEGKTDGYDSECPSRPGEQEQWIRLTVAPVTSNGSPVRDVILMHLDITDRKRAEHHLLQQATELTRANAELQEFAYVASHDLREPLRTVKSFSQLLIRKFQDVVDDEATRFASYVTEGVTRMEDLINDLLLYSRVIHAERQEDNPEVVSLNHAVAAAVRNLDSLIGESRARICIGELPLVAGEYTQLVQLFQNLIGNAIKYRGPERPLIEIASLQAEGGPVVSVSDNGIGIHRQYHESIFGLFKRLHPRSVPGTGIGLALCRKIAESHGGWIRVESEPGRGSTFYVKLAHRAGQASQGLA